MENKYSVQLNSPEDTREFATKLAKYVQPGSVIALEGDLGAGKTVFTQGLAIGLGVTQLVNSPTFTIIKEYDGIYPLYHMDVYRLDGYNDDLGFDDYFYGDGVTIVEWASIIEDYLPGSYLKIAIEKYSETKRKIVLIPYGEKYKAICEEFFVNENFSD